MFIVGYDGPLVIHSSERFGTEVPLQPFNRDRLVSVIRKIFIDLELRVNNSTINYFIVL